MMNHRIERIILLIFQFLLTDQYKIIKLIHQFKSSIQIVPYI